MNKLKDITKGVLSRADRKIERMKQWKRPTTKAKRSEGTAERREGWEAKYGNIDSANASNS